MATNTLATTANPQSQLKTIVGLSQGDLEKISDEKGEDFLSLILKNLEQKDGKNGKNTILNSLLSKNDLKDIKIVENIELLKLDKNLESLQLEESTFIQILQFLEHLNGGKKVTTLPKMNDKLNLLLKNASILEEFKGANSLKDILNLSKKYNLGLDKISITKNDIATLKETFPALEKRGFFKSLQTTISSQDFLKNSKKQIAKFESKEQNSTKPTQTLSTILQNITKDEKEKKVTQTQNDKAKIVKNPQSLKSGQKEVLHEVKKKTNEEKVTLNESNKSEKTVLHEEKIDQNNRSKELNKNILKDDEDRIKQNLNSKEKEVKHSIKEDQKLPNNDKTITTNVPLKEQMAQKDEIKPIKTESNDNKSANLQENFQEKKGDFSEQKQESQQQSFAKDVSKADNLQVKSSNLRHTLNSFAQDFKEKLEEYKPPIMKVKMSLNPKSLGQMDVTIVNRGNNLQVNITSNTSAMNLFLQNQAEFKNSLVNMGFTNLQMNFSDQRQNNQHNQNNQSGTGFASSYEDEEHEELATENTILNIVIPDYV